MCGNHILFKNIFILFAQNNHCIETFYLFIYLLHGVFISAFSTSAADF